MKHVLFFPLLPLAAVALAGGCSDDPTPAPAYNPMATAGGVTSAGPAATNGAVTTTGAGVATTGSGVTSTTGAGFTSTGGAATTAAPTSGTTGSGTTDGLATTTGSSSTAAAGSTGGAGGTSSSTGTGTGTSTTGTVPAEGSSGCGTPASQELGEWVSQGNNPEWAIYLPENYDPDRAYPLVVQLHGCTDGTNNVPVERESGEDAIHVRGTGTGANTCWDIQADLPIFDTMVDGVKAAACVDENRVFASGYSSGAGFVSYLACVRGDVLRAAGTVAGFNARPRGDCSGTIAQIFIHGLDDTDNDWDNGQNGDHINAMEALLEANGCTADSAVAEAPEPCERYQGCGGNPVKVCLPPTGNHGRRDDYAAAAFWEFFSEF